ncbi:glycosyltransferase family 2 protein [Candidatus Bathyarchaeota archaeon]|nr:glycosyltransferase family 2 protein [Candidatus Bathyarchaeota archaeon]
MQSSNPLISVVIPAFNEQANIVQVIAQTESALDSLNLPYEVIVVDDGSNDNTKRYASNNGAKLISYNVNRGKGYAMRVGFAQAKGKILVTIDADGSFKPNEIPRMIKPLLNGIDVVVGSRFLAKNGEVTSKLHIFGNSIFNTLIMLLTQKRITDSQTGFRAFTRKVLKELKLFSEGFEIETELTIKMLQNGFKIQEEPISCSKRRHGRSKLNTFSDGFSILKTIIKANFI